MSRPEDDVPTLTSLPSDEGGQVLPVGGGYRLLAKLGQGAFGIVWRAAAPGGVEVAVKVISRTIQPEEARRELEALEVIKRLRHQNLLSLQAFFPLADRLIIVLELADASLRTRLRVCQSAGQGLAPNDLLRYMREAAEALDYLHEQKVQHRDIKPDNLLLLGHHLKVADCGLARVLESVVLQSASHAGTPAYMAPEIWAGKLSPHSDQYSLAVSYAELRLGRAAFPHDSLANLMYAHLQGQPELDPLPVAEQGVLRRALAKEPGERYPSCTAFAEALAQVHFSLGPESCPIVISQAGEPAAGSRAPADLPAPPVSSPAAVTAPPAPATLKESAPGPRSSPPAANPAPAPAVTRPKRRPLIRWVIAAGLLLALGVWLVPGKKQNWSEVRADLPPANTYRDLTRSERSQIFWALYRLAEQLHVKPLSRMWSTERLLEAINERLGSPDPARDPVEDLSSGPLLRRLQALLWKHGVAEYRDPKLTPVELVERLQKQVVADPPGGDKKTE